ncbi:MAG: hypothetical protein ACI38O_05555 [Fibrobacter intestinalis]|uniref:hypothetical protein n=1 Tax=Fibrobacter intestinalis TaxID=28122 RepID=UPI003F0EB906
MMKELTLLEINFFLVNPFEDFIYEKVELNSYYTTSNQISDDIILSFDYSFEKSAYGTYSDAFYYKKATIWNVLKNEKHLLVVDSASDSSDYFLKWKEGCLKNFLISTTKRSYDMEKFLYKVFFVLDSSTFSIKKWIPSGESAWISDCNDIQWTEHRFRCLMEEDDIMLLDEKRNVLGSVTKKNYSLDENTTYFRFYGNYIALGHQIYKMYENGKISDRPLFEVYLDYGRACVQHANGTIVSYTKNELRPE